MATYCIGDIQGCFQELQTLLHTIKFNSNKDYLWFVGDLVNRGPESLEVLRFIKALPNKIVVLGNHDLHLLTIFHKTTQFETKWFQKILAAPDAHELIDWVRKQKLLYYNHKFDTILVHAGIIPDWDLDSALKYAAEVEAVLGAKNYIEFLKHMYGNEPHQWNEKLVSWDRLRFFVNCFTRLRFCTKDNKLDFTANGKIGSQPENYFPWFNIPERKTKNHKIVFGHWAALAGKVFEPNVYALDTGCVWGGELTALRLEDMQRFAVPCRYE
jgi:bis(5'-nucleosyl)-tetraphosphatase (symmetrical)